MNRRIVFSTLLTGVLFYPDFVFSQTKLNLRNQSKNVDFSNATQTKPFQAGNALPALCDTGEAFYLLPATPGSNLYGCTSTNQWTLLTSAALPSPIGQTGNVLAGNGTAAEWRSLSGDVTGSPEALVVKGLRAVEVAATAPLDGQVLVFKAALNRWEPGSMPAVAPAWPVTRASNSVLTVGAGPGLRIGSTYCQLPTDASVTVSGGTGSLFLFVRPTCQIVVAHNIAVSGCTSCVAVAGAGYEPNSFPLAKWDVTGGVLAPSGTAAVTSYSVQPMLPGQNVHFTYSGGQTQVHAFAMGVNLASNALSLEWSNAALQATERARLASWVAVSGNSFVGKTPTGGGTLAGIVVGGEGSTGKARLAFQGIAQCEFENAVAALDWVVPGTQVAGKCRSVGSAKPTVGALVGQVLETGAPGTYNVIVDIRN